MVALRPLRREDLDAFEGTTYAGMDMRERLSMLSDSLNRRHNGRYFETLTALDGDHIVGFMNLYAHSEHIVGIGPDIREPFRRRGLGYEGMRAAMVYAKSLGYTVASNSVRRANLASVALHRKLGFEADREYRSENGTPMIAFLRAL